MKWLKVIRLVGEILVAFAAGFGGSYVNGGM